MFSRILLITCLICLSMVAKAFVPRSIVSSSRLKVNTPASSILRSQTHLKVAIHDAAIAGDFEKVKEMIEKDPTLISKYDIDGQIPLHFAAKGGHLEMAKWLIEKGPGYVNFKNIRYRTPLHWATSYAGYEGFDDCEEIAYLLVKNGADLKIENKDRQTPLDHAKKGPLGKAFHDKLKEMSIGVEIRPVDLSVNRVYWG